MAGFDHIAVVLLAGGRGQRFGSAKLRANLGGMAVALHAASHLAALPFLRHIAVVGPGAPDLSGPGFCEVPLEPADAPMSRSVALGVAQAQRDGASAVMIALADMPLVPQAHFRALVAAFDGDRIATHGGKAAMPPAIFGAIRFPALLALEGDRGAGILTRDAPTIPLAPDLAIDVDRPDDLARAALLLGQ